MASLCMVHEFTEQSHQRPEAVRFHDAGPMVDKLQGDLNIHTSLASTLRMVLA